MQLTVIDLFDVRQTDHPTLFAECNHPWEALPKINDYLNQNLQPAILGQVSTHAIVEGNVFIGEGTLIEPNVFIQGPAWIGRECHIRQGAYLRGNVIVGNNCILGNSCEFKNCVLLNEAKVPHFAYVGDSILGYRAHLGAGVTLSNLKITEGNIEITMSGVKIDTGLRKFGAIIGDEVEIGCHCVLNPGSIVGRRAVIYPGVSWRGICPPNTVVKLRQEHELVIRAE